MGSELTPVPAMVGTGAIHSIMPEPQLRMLGLSPSEIFLYAVTTGRELEYGYGMARVGLEGRDFHRPVIFGP